jgi:large subunit ribosomal protein L7/L12
MVDQSGEALVDIIVGDAGQRPIGLYNLVKGFTALNIKQARKLVDGAPQPVITRVPKTQAEGIKIEIEALGATVELRASAGPVGAPTDLL